MNLFKQYVGNFIQIIKIQARRKDSVTKVFKNSNNTINVISQCHIQIGYIKFLSKF